MEQEEKLIKNRECALCEKIFDCPGKPRTTKECVNFVPRKKDEDGKR